LPHRRYNQWPGNQALPLPAIPFYRPPQPEVAETITVPPLIKEPFREEIPKPLNEAQNVALKSEETLISPQPDPQPLPRESIVSNEFSFRPPKPEPDLFSPGGPTISDKLKEEKTTLNQRLQQDSPGIPLVHELNQIPIKI